MSGIFIRLLLLVAIVAFAGFSAEAHDAAPRTCVFIGDAITVGVRNKPVAVTANQRFSYLVAKQTKCREVNIGAGPDTTDAMLARFDNDVPQHKPSIIYIMTQNDFWPLSQVPLQRSETNLRALIEKGKALGAEVQLITPPPLTEANCRRPVPRDSCKKLVKQISLEPVYLGMQRRVANETGVRLIDANKAMGRRAVKLLGDPWNPNPAGHKFIAELID